MSLAVDDNGRSLTVDVDQSSNGTSNAVYPLPTSSPGAVSITRTADTNAYAAGDVIGTATGSTAAIEFTNVGIAGRVTRILSALMLINRTDIPSGMTNFTLHFYSVTPPSALGDNAAWDLATGDRASYLGHITSSYAVDMGSTLEVEFKECNLDVQAAGTSIFAYLKTEGAFTPASATVKTIKLNTLVL